MKKILILLLLFTGDSFAVARYSKYSKSFVRGTRGFSSGARRNFSTVGSPTVKSSALVHHTLQTFQHWIARQNTKTQQVIRNSQIVNRYNHLLAERMKGIVQVDLQIQLFNRMMQFMMKNQDQAEEIMQFYTQLNQANAQVHKALVKQPQEFQQLLNSRVQGYALHVQDVEDNEVTLTGIQRLKLLMIRAYPYLVCSLLLGMQMLTVAVGFYASLLSTEVKDHWLKTTLTIEELEKDSRVNQVLSAFGMHVDYNIIEVFNIITEAFNLDDVQLRIALQSSAPAFASKMGAAGEAFVALHPHIFTLPFELQVFILLHEIRHIMQYNQISIPQDIIQFAVDLGVKSHGVSLTKFIFFSTFYSTAMMEVDADAFAAQQLGDSHVAQVVHRYYKRNKFDPNTGYLKGGVMDKLVPLEDKFHDFVKPLLGRNVYVDLLPDHIKQQAQENRAKKQGHAKVVSEKPESLFDSEW